MTDTLTRIPEVVTALAAAFAAATSLKVYDGPFVGELMDEAVCVGITPDATPGYLADVERQDGLGRVRLVERFSVSSLLTITSGTDDIPTLRARAGALLADIDTALRDAHDAPWNLAHLSGRMQWVPIQHAGGATVNVFFDVVGTSLL